MKKKILLISESMGGGLRKHIVQLIENIDKKKFDIYLIYGTRTNDDTFKKQLQCLSSQCTLIPCEIFNREINISNDIKTLLFLNKKIKEIKPNIVHCHSSKAGALGRLAAKINSVSKIYYTPHAYSFLAPEFSNIKKIFFILIEKFLSRYMTTLTFNVSKGEKNKALVSNLDKNKKFKVIYNGLHDLNFPDKNVIKQSLGIPENSYVIGTNARMSVQKNPYLFAKIAKEIIGNYNDIYFIWAGDGPLMEEIKKFIELNKLEKNFILLGDRDDTELIVCAYDIFLSTSDYEGLPYAPIEAKRAGIPIIASDVTGNNEVLIDKISGFLFKKDDMKSAINIISDLYTKRKQIKKEVVLDEFDNVFSIKKMIASYEEIYSEGK